jgi:hypothetical protein
VRCDHAIFQDKLLKVIRSDHNASRQTFGRIMSQFVRLRFPAIFMWRISPPWRFPTAWGLESHPGEHKSYNREEHVCKKLAAPGMDCIRPPAARSRKGLRRRVEHRAINKHLQIFED